MTWHIQTAQLTNWSKKALNEAIEGGLELTIWQDRTFETYLCHLYKWQNYGSVAKTR